MSTLGEVFGSLGSMSQLQLLFAFVACAAYAFAQGSLLPAGGRRIAWATTASAAFGFSFMSEDWTFAAVLLGFAVAGLATFVALVWLTSRLVGLNREPLPVALDSVPVDSSFPPHSEAPRSRPPHSSEPAHVV